MWPQEPKMIGCTPVLGSEFRNIERYGAMDRGYADINKISR